MATISRVKPREGAGIWLIKIIFGLLIVLLLGLHFIVNHLIAPGGLLTWTDVVRYYQNPAVLIIEAAFLITVVTHSLIGTRSIIIDLNPSESLLRFLDVIFIVVGIVAVGYGIWLLAVVSSFKPA